MAAKKNNEPSAAMQAATALPGFKVKKIVTVPLWKWTDGVPKFFTILEPVRLSTAKQTAGGKDGKKMDPAHVALVKDLATGNEQTLIFGAVLLSNLNESYANEGYVGKSFQVVQSKIEGKRYKGYSISEIEAE